MDGKNLEARVKANRESDRCEFDAHGARCLRVATHNLRQKRACVRCAASALGVLFFDPIEQKEFMESVVEQFGASRISVS